MVNFINPVPNSYITSKFGWREHPTTFKLSWHQGVDLGIKPNTNVPVLASADGEVIRNQVMGTYGNMIVLRHVINGKVMETNYAHLKEKAIPKVGTKVKQGDKIGIMGMTGGSSTGIHLHFEIHMGVWKTNQPNAVDPMKYFKLTDKLEVKKEVKVEVVPVMSGKTETKVKRVYLPKTADKWNVYSLDKAPIKANAIATLNPKKFGGLDYEILGNPQVDVYTIKTTNFGKVNIYAHKSTGAVIK